MAVELGWQRRHPHIALDRAAAGELIGRDVLDLELLSGGLRNTNYRLKLAGQESQEAVLRLHTADAGACAREAALLRLVARDVPVPAVLRSEPEARPPWALLAWMDGVRFDQMLVSSTPAEVAEACASAGAVLAAIHRFAFAAPGFLGPRLEIAEPMGYSWLTGVREFFAQDRARELVGSELAQQVVQLVDREGWRLDAVWSQSRLAHADYKPWNLLVRRGPHGWRISAVLDWEFSLSAPPLCDVGIFLRYASRLAPEYETSFLAAYVAAGGVLPPDARNMARLIDLVSLWTFLERAEVEAAVVGEVKSVLQETLGAFR